MVSKLCISAINACWYVSKAGSLDFPKSDVLTCGKGFHPVKNTSGFMLIQKVGILLMLELCLCNGAVLSFHG